MELQPLEDSRKDTRVLVDQLIQQQYEIVSDLQKRAIEESNIEPHLIHIHTAALKDLIEMRLVLEPRYLGRPSDIDAIAKTAESKIREKLLGSVIK